MAYARWWIGAGVGGVALASLLVFRALGQPQRVLVDGVAIVGSETFIARTREALDLIKISSVESYSQLTSQVLTIEEYERSGADVWNRRIQVGAPTSSYSLTWYASTLMHDCRHVAQYQDYLRAFPNRPVPPEVFTGRDAELSCMGVQIELLQRMNAPEKELEWARKQNGDFADVNRDGKLDKTDYKKRDW